MEESDDEIDPLDAFMAENNEEAIKDLEESVVTTKMDRMKEMHIQNIDPSKIGSQISKELGFQHQSGQNYKFDNKEEEIIDQEDGLDALYDKSGQKMKKRTVICKKQTFN